MLAYTQQIIHLQKTINTMSILSSKETQILTTLRKGLKVDDFFLYKSAFRNLSNYRYISCNFDEQGDLINVSLTPLGKKIRID